MQMHKTASNGLIETKAEGDKTMYDVYFATDRGSPLLWHRALNFQLATKEEAIAIAKALKAACHVDTREFAVCAANQDAWIYKTTE